MSIRSLIRSFSLALVMGSALLLSGCGPETDDDYLCTIPTTNNPNLIEDSGRSSISMPNQF